MNFNAGAFSSAGGAVSDLFAASADRSKAAGDRIEAQNYDLASSLATQNEKFTETSTAIKESQQQRELMLHLGGQQAHTHAILGKQGLITEAAYTKQAQSYTNMAGAARMAADAADNAAKGAGIT